MPATRIVIALEPGRVSPEAIELGHVLGLATGAPLTLLAVWRWWEPVELAMIAGEHSLREEAHDVLRDIGHRLRSRGHNRVDERLRAATSIGSALHDTAEEATTGLLVLGPAHRGPTGRVLAGSTASNFLHGAPCPVAIPPRGYVAPAGWPRRIGVAYADTDEGREALRGAAALARCAGRRSASSRWPTRGSRRADARAGVRRGGGPRRPPRGHDAGRRGTRSQRCRAASPRRPSRSRASRSPRSRTPLTMLTCWSADRAATGRSARCCSAASRGRSCIARRRRSWWSRAGASDGWNSCWSITRSA